MLNHIDIPLHVDSDIRHYATGYETVIQRWLQWTEKYIYGDFYV